MQIDFGKLKKRIPDLIVVHRQLMVLLWKMGLGKLINSWPALFGSTLVISQPAGSSGSALLTPLHYFSQGEWIYCTTFIEKKTDWALNVIANPQVEIWLPDGWYAGRAEIVEEGEERAAMLSKLLAGSGAVAQYLCGIHPLGVEEEKLREATADLRLLRVSRQSPRTGADGPGSLAWLWPLLFMLCLLRRRRR